MRKKAVEITKVLLAEEMIRLGVNYPVDRMVFQGGQDPGGWSNQMALVCVIHEGAGLPNDYNHPDPLSWWDELGTKVGKLLGERVYFEWINSCVAALYRI